MAAVSAALAAPARQKLAARPIPAAVLLHAVPIAARLAVLTAVQIVQLRAALTAARLPVVRIAVPLPSNRDDALAELISLSETMAAEGRALIERVLPAPPATYTQWEHYPKGDAIDPTTKARWFYHAHPPEQRGPKEHGHFHLFLPLSAFDGQDPWFEPEKPKNKKKKLAQVVHVAALCFNADGIPTHWIATNQWVTNEYLFPAEDVIARLDQMDMSEAGVSKDIPHVGRWLTCAFATARADVEALLRERDEKLADTDPRDKEAEILATVPFQV